MSQGRRWALLQLHGACVPAEWDWGGGGSVGQSSPPGPTADGGGPVGWGQPGEAAARGEAAKRSETARGGGREGSSGRYVKDRVLLHQKCKYNFGENI